MLPGLARTIPPGLDTTFTQRHGAPNIAVCNKPGIGTVANVIVIAVTVDAGLAVLAAPESVPARIALMLAAVLLNAVATVLYVGAGLGPGPRDGLMTGLVARSGLSVRLVRTAIEATVLSAGWLLGGSVGIGTVIYAFGIGPMVQLVLRLTPTPILAASGWAHIADKTRIASDPTHADRGECGTMVQCPIPPTRSTPTC